MKEVKKYIAFDDTEFDTRTECLAYEKEGFQKSLSNKLAQYQISKAQDLPILNRRYEKAKEAYKIACTEKMSLKQRTEIFQNYFSIKSVYEVALKGFQALKIEIRNLQAKKVQ